MTLNTSCYLHTKDVEKTTITTVALFTKNTLNILARPRKSFIEPRRTTNKSEQNRPRSFNTFR